MPAEFFAIGLAGKVAFFDLAERADLGLFEREAWFARPGSRFQPTARGSSASTPNAASRR